MDAGGGGTSHEGIGATMNTPALDQRILAYLHGRGFTRLGECVQDLAVTDRHEFDRATERLWRRGSIAVLSSVANNPDDIQIRKAG